MNHLTISDSEKLSCGEAAFLFYEANIWNSLPEGVREASTPAMFKSRLKKGLFRCI